MTQVAVVDDSQFARRRLIQALPKNWEVTINEARNGQEAVELCRAGKADIMFLDLTMPIMNGYQVLETMKKERLFPQVIVLSADIQPKAQARVEALGARAFVKKPATPEQLHSLLQGFKLL